MAQGDASERSCPEEAGSIYRYRALTELQGVRVERVDLSVDDAGVVSEVRLQVAGTAIHLLAGEVYEGMHGMVDRQKGR